MEQLAEKGEVLVHESALAALERRGELGETRASAEAGVGRVIARLREPAPEAGAPAEDARSCPPSSHVRGCSRPSTSGSRPVAASSWPSSDPPIRSS